MWSCHHEFSPSSSFGSSFLKFKLLDWSILSSPHLSKYRRFGHSRNLHHKHKLYQNNEKSNTNLKNFYMGTILAFLKVAKKVKKQSSFPLKLKDQRHGLYVVRRHNFFSHNILKQRFKCLYFQMIGKPEYKKYCMVAQLSGSNFSVACVCTVCLYTVSA